MSNIRKNVLELIGHTPLMEVVRMEEQQELRARLLVKLELFNPAGSVKDRVARSMVLDAEEKGLIHEGATLIEPTSGNTGIGLAAIAAGRGYHAILTMPDTMSIERRKLLQGYGAKIVLTDGKLGMTGAIEKAEELTKEIENSIVLGQFVNPANAKAHMDSTGPEIWEDTDGEIDVFVAGVGTGGTITGVGNYLKQKNSQIQVVAVEPRNSAVLSGGKAGNHGLQGIGAGFIPTILDSKSYDKIVTVEEQEAYEAVWELAHTEGILVGISSGAALYAALSLAKKKEYEGKTIVALLPDTGERYLSTPIFD
ncbi:MAG: cysteine synthase A [Lachnospiraceae bacterium]